MAVSRSVGDEVRAELGDWNPDKPVAPPQPTPETTAQRGWSLGESLATTGKELGAGYLVGGRSGLEGYSLFPKALFAATPLGTVQSVVEPAIKSLAPEIPELPTSIKTRAEHPQTFLGRVLEPGAEGLGAITVMPVGGPGAKAAKTLAETGPQVARKVAAVLPKILPEGGAEAIGALERNIIVGLGMGEGAEIGKKVIGGMFNYFAPGGGGRQVGEFVGSVVGGGAGSQANMVRVRGMTTAAGGLLSTPKMAWQAYQSAQAKREAARQADQEVPALWRVFADEFGNLRAQTKGFAQEYVNRELASTVAKDFYATEHARQFDQSIAAAEADRTPFGLGERTMVPALTATIAGTKPESYADAATIVGRAGRMQQVIVDAFNKWRGKADLPASKDGILATAQLFQKITQTKVDALAAEEGQIRGQFPRWSPSDAAVAGQQARGLRDQLEQSARARGKARYTMAEDSATREGGTVDPGTVREEAAAILKEFYASVEPKEVPPIVRDLLGATAGDVETAAAPAAARVPGNIQAYVESQAGREGGKAGEAGRVLSLKEANDLFVALGNAASNARAAERPMAMNRALTLQRKLVDSIKGSTTLSAETKDLWRQAVEGWRTDYAERFQEGMGKALGKERGGAFEGRETIKDEKIIGEVLSGPTALAEFDKLYGNVPAAQNLLRRGLEDRFRQDVLDQRYMSDDVFTRRLDAFKRKYDDYLPRFPELVEKVDEQAGQMVLRQAEKKAELERYQSIMGGPVTKAIGYEQAKQFFTNLLTEPTHMESFLRSYTGSPKELVKEIFEQANPFKNDEYDSKGLLAMLRAGKRTTDAPSSMELLFNKAFGEEGGKRHLATLEAIADLAIRQKATDPRNLQAPKLLDEPVKALTGSSGPSLISSGRAAALGQTSVAYPVILGVARFTSAKMQAAYNRARYQALYDPAEADAILELAVKARDGQPISATTGQKVWGNIRLPNGKKLVDHMMDIGYIQKNVSRGILYGTESSQEDEKQRSK